MKTKESVQDESDDSSGEITKQGVTLASKLAEVDPEFADFLKSEDQDLLDVDMGEVEDISVGDDDDGESENEELPLDSEVEDESEGDKEEKESIDDDDEDIVPLSSEGEEDDADELPDKILKSKKKRREGDDVTDVTRTLRMSQIHEWSKVLTRVMAGEIKAKAARQVIDQIVAALRCAADKIKPAEKGDMDPSEKDKKKRKVDRATASDEEPDDEDEEHAAKKPKKKNRKESDAFSKLFDVVGVREFHAVVKLCVSQLIPSFLAVLRSGMEAEQSTKNRDNEKKLQLTQQAHQLRRSVSWARLKLSLRVYVETLVDLVKYTSDESVATELLAHLNTEDAQMLVFALPATRRTLVQSVVNVWSKGCLLSSSELLEQCHILIISTIRHCPATKVNALYERIFRRLYRAFMSACKFNPKRGADEQSTRIVTSMQSQLASFVLSAPLPTMAHTLAFVKIRQLCGQLRAAYSAASTETRARSAKVVMSWPFLRCINLWTEVVCTSPEQHALRQLVYPLTQLTVGTARLQPSPRYYPLRMHCIQFLNRLALATNTFIPTLSLILDIFSTTDFNAAAATNKNNSKSDESKVSSLNNLIHFSESQLNNSAVEGGMLDIVVNNLLYIGTAETLAIYAHRVAFPELSLALVVRLKKFTKVCHVPRFVERMKVLLSKIEENSRWIEERRRSASDLHPSNTAAVRVWETEARSANPPFLQFASRVKSTMSLVNKHRKKQQQETSKSENRKRKSPIKLKVEPKSEDSDTKNVGNKKKPFRKFQKKSHFNRAKRVKREVS